jgi:hypothetical protein
LIEIAITAKTFDDGGNSSVSNITEPMGSEA